MKKIFNYILPGMLLVPVIVSAQFDEVDTFFQDMTKFINGYLIPLLLAVSFLVFIVGIAQFFFSAKDDNADAKAKGKSLMLWGIFAFVVIVSIWGIVALIANGLGWAGEDLENIPRAPNS